MAKLRILLGLLLATVAVVSATAAETKYTTKYDDIDLDEVLRNDRLYQKYFKCLTGEEKCTPDGKELKDNLPEALQTDCSRCTDKQREGAEKVIKFIHENRPDDFAVLEKLFDPEGKYWSKYTETKE